MVPDPFKVYEALYQTFWNPSVQSGSSHFGQEYYKERVVPVPHIENEECTAMDYNMSYLDLETFRIPGIKKIMIPKTWNDLFHLVQEGFNLETHPKIALGLLLTAQRKQGLSARYLLRCVCPDDES